MAGCPIKDDSGELEDQALQDLVTVGGHIVEGGIKDYGQWKAAMKSTVGDVMSEGDYSTVWGNVRAEATRRTGQAQTATKSDVFIEKMARRLGSNRAAANFANALVDEHGSTALLGKIVDEKPLTPAEQAQVAQAVKDHIVKSKPGGKATSGPMGIVQEALDAARMDKQKAKTVAGAKAPKAKLPPPSEQANFGRRIKAGLGDNTDDFFTALRDDHRDIANALDNGHALTSEQEGRLGDLYMDHAPGPKTPTEATGMIRSLNDAVKESRKESAGTFHDEPVGGYKVAPDKEAVQGEPPPSDDVLFDRKMAGVLGGSDAAAKFRNSLPTDLYDKMVMDGPKKLTHKEQETVTHAFAESAKPKAGSKPSDFVESLKPIATEARAQIARDAAHAKTATFEASKGWVREQLADKIPDRRLKQLDDALDALPDGNHKALSNVFSRFAPRGFIKTGRLATQGDMLSNSGSLATALYSHLISAGVENTVAKGIASKLSGGLHASVDYPSLAHAIGTSLKEAQGIATAGRHGTTESLDVLKHGENALTMEGRNSLHKPGQPLRPELTYGDGGKVGNIASAIGRTSGRMHGAAWHSVGVGLNEIMKQDAAHYGAIDEMESRKEKWTPEQIKVRARELYDHPTQAVLDNADKLREEQMFQNPNAGANVAKALGPVATPVIPFATVASNITGRALEHTAPGAAVSAGIEIGRFVKANRLPMSNLSDFKAAVRAMPAVDRAHLFKIAARGIVGTGAAALGAAGYAGGMINPPDPKHGEYGSMNAFGNKYEIGRVLGPYATPIFGGAYAEQNREAGGYMLPDIKQSGESLADNPMGNAAELYNSTFGGERIGKGKPSEGAKLTASVLGTQIPSVVRAMAAQFDPQHVLRNANSDQFLSYIFNSLKKAVPGARETLPEYPYPEAGTIFPVPRHVPDPNMPANTSAMDFLKQWGADRANRGNPQ